MTVARCNMKCGWFKAWNELPWDDKFETIAQMAGSEYFVALGVWLCICSYANQQPSRGYKRGTLTGLDPRDIASRGHRSLAEVNRIIAAFHEKGMLNSDQITAWERRQDEKSPLPRSVQAIRQERYRARRDAPLYTAVGIELPVQHKPKPELPGSTAEARSQQPFPEAPEPISEAVPEPVRSVTSDITPSVTTGAERDLESSGSNDPESIPQKPLKTEGKEAEAEFEQFWMMCPRKVEKLEARRAYWKARKGARGRPAASWAALLTGMRAYAAKCYAENREEIFIKHPATWLNKGCWEDIPGVSGAPPSPTPEEEAEKEAKRLDALARMHAEWEAEDRLKAETAA